jgi:hypothetical protein
VVGIYVPLRAETPEYDLVFAVRLRGSSREDSDIVFELTLRRPIEFELIQ